ncbi:anti-repressor protein [Paenalcaligenes hominis]|uniref:Anti-repressor protein n=1 Tax=Paenalcaligenes hominis TaxID=643674 RepID=A0ABX0WMH7_9BURK|nr:phage antirepressor KilAC domain-containing protein [Paenalcaligenes hominis]NJB64358.1 anti-repressor protein [Paenalcaligenes hominis]GGE68249.1 hypothetical protein GCM10007278_15430 [Paenalcaligenes hominis]
MSSLIKQDGGLVDSRVEGSQMGVLLNLCQREIDGELIQTVDARELHIFLEVGRDFHTWLAGRIDQYGFVEGQDFTPISGKSSGGRPSKEYALSIDMAKELSMVERNEKGRQARQYFIECERQAKELVNRDPMELLNDPSVLRQTLLGYSEKVIALETKVEEQAPKVEALERISEAEGAVTLTNAAKILQQQPRKFNDWLHSIGWIYRRLGRNQWTAYQQHIQTGRLTHKVNAYIDGETGESKISEQVMVTPKGIAKLSEMLNMPPTGSVPPATNAYLEARG